MSFSLRKVRTGMGTLLWGVLIVSALVLINLIAARGRARIDLTDDSRFTLAQASIDAVSSLPEAVKIEVFFSDGLPGPLAQMQRDLTDLLADYAAHSDGLMTFEFVVPEANEESRARAESFALAEYRLQAHDQNELNVRMVYTGMAFVVDGVPAEEVPTIPQILPGINTEYEITRVLRELSLSEDDDGIQVLGVAYGDGGLFDPILAQASADPTNPTGRQDVQDRISGQLEQMFDELYEIRFVNLASPDGIPSDVEGLFVIGPSGEWSDVTKRNLDQYIMAGNPVALFVSPYYLETLQIDQPEFRGITIPAANDFGLTEMLDHYGVHLNDDALFETQLPHMQLTARNTPQQPNAMAIGGDPRLPIIVDINQESLIVTMMTLVAFLPPDRDRVLSQTSLVATPDALEREVDGDLTITEVLRTSSTSLRWDFGDDDEHYRPLELEALVPWLEQQDDDLQADADSDLPPVLDSGPFTIAMTIEGQLPSAVADDGDSEYLTETSDGRVFVVANGYWVHAFFSSRDPLLRRDVMRVLNPAVRQMIQNYRQSNYNLLRNTADWLAQDTALVTIRGRGTPSYLSNTDLDDADKTFYKVFNIAGVPLLFCLAGLVGYGVRRARRSGIRRRFEATDSRGQD